MKNKILSAAQIQESDKYTIENDGIASIDLMERASLQFVHAIVPFVHGKPAIHIFCGSGNNGGDGFAVARLLKEKGCLVHTYLLETGGKLSQDCQANHDRFDNVRTIENENDLPRIKIDDIVIDALLGTGLKRPAEGLLKTTIEYLNKSGARILSIDIPSGLPCDEKPFSDTIVKACFTGTFERPKKAFFMNESAPYVGNWQVIHIGLNAGFMAQQESDFHYLTDEFFSGLILPRNKFSHKGTYGHGLLIAGSKGKIGSVVLASKAALRSGIGLLTTFLPECGYQALQTAVPEAMCLTDENHNHITHLTVETATFSAIGIGPGMGTEEGTKNALEQLFSAAQQPLVIDADALNVLAKNPDLLAKIPKNTILTPHPKEFERLAGKSADSFERLDLQVEFAKKHRCIVVLKDAITSIALPDGKVFFNTTGNPGMATGGTGDVLTGLITGLLAQGYTPENAALIGVFYHGKAGDAAALQVGENQMIASDLIQYFRLPS